jgi:hypothetical protein
METVISKAKATKIYVGSGAGNPDESDLWVRRGVDWILIATDFSLMVTTAAKAVETIRSWATTTSSKVNG